MSVSGSNIVLIGMPGSGKSTVGVILAKRSSRDFVDTDVVIQTTHHRTLQEIVDQDGHGELRRIEQEVLCGLSVETHVVATGGSAVYSDEAMRHLSSGGVVVFLDVGLAELEARVGDFSSRGLAKPAGQSFADLFEERRPLYLKYADVVIDCTGLSQETVCERIVSALSS